MSRDWCKCDTPQPQPAEGEAYWYCGACGDFTQDPTAEARLSQVLERIERATEEASAARDVDEIPARPVAGVSDENPEWITAAEVARGFAVSRDYVYENKARFGGEPLGTGPRPRWRFPASILTPTETVEGNGSPKAEDGRSDRETRP